jgi:hypothetical protein
LIQALDAAVLRMLDAHPIGDPSAHAQAPNTSKPPSPAKVLTKIKSSETLHAPVLCEECVTFTHAQVAAPADACVWPAASKQLSAVAMLETLLRGLAQVLDACDCGVAKHFAARDWSLLAANLRALVQRGKYYDLPQLKHKNVQSDTTTAATLQLLAACLRAKCNYATITEDGSFMEAIFGIMNNPGAAGPNAALAAVLELAKLPDTQRAISSTFGYLTGTKAGASWKNSAMSKMSHQIKRLCATEGPPPSKSAAKSSSGILSVQNDEDEDEDFPTEGFGARSPLLPPISPAKSLRSTAGSPSSRAAAAAAAAKASPVCSPQARDTARARATPRTPSSSGHADTRPSHGVASPPALVLPSLK